MGLLCPQEETHSLFWRAISGTVEGDQSSDSTRKVGGVPSYHSGIGGITLAATYYQAGAEEAFKRLEFRHDQ